MAEIFFNFHKHFEENGDVKYPKRNLFNIYYLKNISLYLYKYFCCIDWHGVSTFMHKYFYYLKPIYYGTLPTHSIMSLSFAPIFWIWRGQNSNFIYVRTQLVQTTKGCLLTTIGSLNACLCRTRNIISYFSDNNVDF